MLALTLSVFLGFSSYSWAVGQRVDEPSNAVRNRQENRVELTVGQALEFESANPNKEGLSRLKVMCVATHDLRSEVVREGVLSLPQGGEVYIEDRYGSRTRIWCLKWSERRQF